mmetsp:Transcript_19985/g.69384  ORF Transcript_19985/g.69384 Transcript_19985/m.69384 type:complete len:283 (+) Transcript_19985:93-941(+)
MIALRCRPRWGCCSVGLPRGVSAFPTLGPASPRRFAAAPAPPVLPLAVVADARIRAALPWLGKLAYITLASGFLMTDIFWLRGILAAGYMALTIYHILQLHPLRIPLFGSLVFCGVNTAMAVMLLRERYLILTDSESTIYGEHFESTMSVSSFKTLMAHGKMLLATEQSSLIKAGEVPDLVLVLAGEAEVVLEGGNTVVAEGALVGEVSFITGAVASATVLSRPGSSYLVWTPESLRQALEENPSLRNGLELKIGRELMRKLALGCWTADNLRREFKALEPP